MRKSPGDEPAELTRLALRIVRHEKLRVMRAHRRILREEEGLIAGAVEAMALIDCKALRAEIESVLSAEFRAQFGNTTCFNCKKMPGCIIKYDPCLGCASYGQEDPFCAESPCDGKLSWEYRINVHLDCPEYRLDRGAFREAVTRKGILVAALSKRCGIHEGRVLRRIDSILQEFVSAIAAGRPVFPVGRCGN
ncbi:MAG: hypothetical protein WC291_01825 [Thermodesulfovibrionales bacterium]